MENKELLKKINNAANIIHKKTLNSANYIITSTKISEAIESLYIKKLRKKKLNSLKNIFK